MPGETDDLGEREIHLWTLDLERGSSEPEILSQEEEQRAARLVRPEDRQRFRAARSFVRQILGRYLKKEPHSLVFEFSEAGKPFVEAFGRSHRISFNLTHSARYGLLAVTLGRKIGVDIETERSLEDLPGMARQIMSSAEWKSFQSVPPHLMHDFFFGLWTRKEALLKAIGTGFLTDPREIDLGLADNEIFAVEFRGRVWSVKPIAIAPLVKAAVAIEGELASIHIFDPDRVRSRSKSLPSPE